MEIITFYSDLSQNLNQTGTTTLLIRIGAVVKSQIVSKSRESQLIFLFYSNDRKRPTKN